MRCLWGPIVLWHRRAQGPQAWTSYHSRKVPCSCLFDKEHLPRHRRYFLGVIAVVIVISAMPAGLHMVKKYGPEARQYLEQRFKLGRPKLDPQPDSD
jgi:hypothetical protein